MVSLTARLDEANAWPGLVFTVDRPAAYAAAHPVQPNFEDPARYDIIHLPRGRLPPDAPAMAASGSPNPVAERLACQCQGTGITDNSQQRPRWHDALLLMMGPWRWAFGAGFVAYTEELF